MKKTLSVLLAVLMLISVIPLGIIPVSAATTATALPTSATNYTSDITINLNADQSIAGYIQVSNGATVNLYMNGHTLTYTNTNTNSMFHLTGGNLNIYGTGTIKSAGKANPVAGGFCHIDGAKGSSKLTIASGSTVNIQGFTAKQDGGAVYIKNGGGFKMYGGVISGCSSGDNGGAIDLEGGTFTMNGGELRDNTTAHSGGAVLVSNETGSSTFTMNGGKIYNNKTTTVCTSTAYYWGGGGVAVFGGSTFNLNGGEIYGNTSANQGGGVMVQNYNGTATFNMKGGSIYDNTAAKGDNADVAAMGTNAKYNQTGGRVGTMKTTDPAFTDNYRQLEYIENTNGQYIKTGYNAGAKVTVSMDLEITDWNGEWSGIFGSRSSSHSDNTFVASHNGSKNELCTEIGSKQYTYPGINPNERIVRTISGTSNFKGTGIELTLFGINNNGTCDTKGAAIYKLYSCKITDDGKVVRDFVPAQRKFDNAVGLYDLRGGKFYSCATSNGIMLSNATDFLSFLEDIAGGNTYKGKTVFLSKDIDLNKTDLKNYSASSCEHAFCGTFDGNGYTIKNVKDTSSSYAGLFRNLGAHAVVQNLTLENVAIDSANGTAGAIASIASERVRIVNVNVKSGYVTGKTNVGGIIGDFCQGVDILDCSNGARIGGKICGGIAGYYWDPDRWDADQACIMKNCSNSGTISADENAGGIIGSLDAGGAHDLSGCTNTGTVMANEGCAGGIAGIKTGGGLFTNCVNGGKVDGALDVGGIVGNNVKRHSYISGSVNYGEIGSKTCRNAGGIMGYTGSHSADVDKTCSSYGNNCINEGTVTASQNAGGIVGYLDSNSDEHEFNNCQNHGNITAVLYNAGGVIGATNGAGYFTNCVNTGKIVGKVAAGGVLGRREQLEFDQIEDIDHDYDDNDFNFSKSENSGEISGANYCGGIAGWTANSSKFHDCVNSGNVCGSYASGGILGFDEGSDVGYSFCTDVYFDGSQNSGNIGSNSAGVISSYSGGIAGYTGNCTEDPSTDAVNCLNTGNVTAELSAGGIIGHLRTDHDDNRLNKSTNKGNVSSFSGNAGGIVGTSYGGGNFTNCINRGKIVGKKTAGGILGWNEDDRIDFTNSENYGDIGDIYFDKLLGEVPSCEISGGIAGWIGDCSEDPKYFGDHCLNYGTVIAKNKAGGIVGHLRTDNKKNYFEGSKNYGTVNAMEGDAGGIIGTSHGGGNFTNCENHGKIAGLVNAGHIIAWIEDDPCDFSGCKWTGTVTKGVIVSGKVVELNSLNDFLNFIKLVSGGNSYIGQIVRLNCDISLRDINYLTYWPAANYAKEFRGTFDGQGHTIEGLQITSKNPAGLFGTLGDGATVKDLRLWWTTVTGSGSSSGYGALAGRSNGNVTLSGITVESGNIKGYTCIGGLIGQVVSGTVTVDYCKNDELNIEATKTSDGRAGGLFGLCNASGTITNCMNTGLITGGYAGGILGVAEGGNLVIKNCINGREKGGDRDYGTITASNSGGGIAGYLGNRDRDYVFEGSNCINYSKVTATNQAGGIVGDLVTDANHNFSGCINTADIVGKTNCAGGIVGRSYGGGDFTECVNSGRVSGKKYAGGILGWNQDDAIDFTGSSNSARVGIVYNGDNCENAGGIAGFLGSTEHNQQYILKDCTNTGYILSDNQAGGIVGDLSTNNTAHKFSGCKNTGDVIGKTNCAGGIVGRSYGGGDFTNCVNEGDIGAKNYAGGIIGWNQDDAIDFSYSTNSGNIGNCNYTECMDAGGIIGYFAGNNAYTAKLCTNTGDVTAQQAAGGIIGYMKNGNQKHVLTSCTNSGAITQTAAKNGAFGAGGIVGVIKGGCDFSGSCNTGAVKAYYSAGGIIGYVDTNSNEDLYSCTNRGAITATYNCAGGITGQAYGGGDYRYCTNDGNISGGNYAGGIVGWNQDDPIDFSYSKNTGMITGATKGQIYGYTGGKVTLTGIVKSGSLASGSVLSEGNLWIIIAVPVLALGSVAALFIVKKKKKPIAANGAGTDDDE